MTVSGIAIDETPWTPGDEVTHHNGDAPVRGRTFLHPPPAEIGEVVSAHSTLRDGKTPWSFTARIALTGLPAGLAAGGLRSLERMFIVGNPIIDSPWPPLVVAAFVFVLAWYLTSFLHTFSFVGTDGIARLTQTGNRHRPPAQSLLLFADAVALHTKQTKQYMHGVYVSTVYDFRWTDSHKTRLLRLKGACREKDGVCKKVEDPFHFAVAAERSWTVHVLRNLSSELEKNGSIQFDLNRDKWVRIGVGFIEFHLGKEDVRVEAEEIRDLAINQGTVRIVHKDATWLGRKGKFSFEYQELANARAFLVALQTIWGIDLS